MKTRKTNKAKRVDRTCRNNNSCPFCKSSRLNQANKELDKTNDQIKEVKNEDHMYS